LRRSCRRKATDEANCQKIVSESFNLRQIDVKSRFLFYFVYHVIISRIQDHTEEKRDTMKRKQRKETVDLILSNFVWLRKKYGLSRKEMAACLRIGIGSWNQIESGIMPPRLSASVLMRVEDCFGIPAKVFISKHLS